MQRGPRRSPREDPRPRADGPDPGVERLLAFALECRFDHRSRAPGRDRTRRLRARDARRHAVSMPSERSPHDRARRVRVDAIARARRPSRGRRGEHAPRVPDVRARDLDRGCPDCGSIEAVRSECRREPMHQVGVAFRRACSSTRWTRRRWIRRHWSRRPTRGPKRRRKRRRKRRHFERAEHFARRVPEAASSEVAALRRQPGPTRVRPHRPNAPGVVRPPAPPLVGSLCDRAVGRARRRGARG